MEQGADFLKVYDGNGFYNKTIVRDTNHNYVIDGIMTGNGIVNAPTVDLANPIFFSTGPNLFFQFKSDVSNARPHRGFKMSYEGVYCAGRLVLTGASGTLTDGSPPGQMYYPYTQCSWHIAPESRFFLTGGAVIELEVVSVNVFKDRLNIYEGNDATGV